MAYDNDFYQAYDAYLRERTVRKAHDQVFALLSKSGAFRNVVDLGCGLSEFYYQTSPRFYVGVDLNMAPTDDTKLVRAQGNYRDVDFVREQARMNGATAFVSLFSSEITASREENTRFYEQLFAAIPSLRTAVVSGFFYQSRKHINPVEETGGIVSYQTLGTIDEYSTAAYDQTWITLRVPSKMFGDDVFEVWRILQANR